MENLEIGRTVRGDPVLAAGAIDVANVLCNRVHPGQRDLYRGDVGYVTFFLDKSGWMDGDLSKLVWFVEGIW